MPHLTHKALKSSKAKDRGILYTLVLAMAIIEPLFTLPQAYNIWIKHEVSGVSITTWGFFTFAAVIWLIYGIKVASIPLVISSTLWILLDGAVVLGLVVH